MDLNHQRKIMTKKKNTVLNHQNTLTTLLNISLKNLIKMDLNHQRKTVKKDKYEKYGSKPPKSFYEEY